jgi:hypothetical protein
MPCAGASVWNLLAAERLDEPPDSRGRVRIWWEAQTLRASNSLVDASTEVCVVQLRLVPGAYQFLQVRPGFGGIVERWTSFCVMQDEPDFERGN